MSGGSVPAGQDLCVAKWYSVIRLQNPVILTSISGLPKYQDHDDRHEPTLIAAAGHR